MALALLLLLPLAGTFAPALLSGRNAQTWGAALPLAAALAILVLLAPGVLGGEAAVLARPWIPAIGLELRFRLDGLAFLFAILILGIGVLVILYSRYYLAENEPLARFYGLLLLFAGAMLGLVLSDNLLLLLVFWEITSICSFLLIGHWNHLRSGRFGARMALVVTGAGGLALLAGLILLGHMAGSFRLSDVLEAGEQVKAHPLYPVMLCLVLLGAFTKSAQFPFHFWLPHAMAAPTPVSAYLHSATMVKAGIFLLARFFPVLSGTGLWSLLVAGTGLATVLFGAYTALFKHDLKGLLAYSTVSHLGLITLLFGLGTPLGAVAGIFHTVNHAIFKASLFMAAGIIDHESGTRDMRRLNGLWRAMPHTAMLAMVAAASMAGVPLLNGFLSKEMFFHETLHHEWLGHWNWVLPGLAAIAGVLSVAYSLRFIHDVFFNGEPVNLPRVPHEPPRWMKTPVEVLVTLCLLVGILPTLTVEPLLDAAARNTLGHPVPEYSLAIWRGLTPTFAMSIAALAGGVLLYSVRHRLFSLHAGLFPRFDAGTAYRRSIRLIEWGSGSATRRVESGGTGRYLAILLITALATGTWAAYPGISPAAATPFSSVDPVTALGALSLTVATFAVVAFHRQRLRAVITLGAVGLIVAVAFVRFAAPDLALTQLAIELVTIILLLLALNFLPQSTAAESRPARRIRDGTVAGAVGLGAGAVTWAMLTRPAETISGYFLAHGPDLGATNIVNAILVDFRAFDTLGETTVLAIAAVGIGAMAKTMTRPLPAATERDSMPASERHPLVLITTTRILLPLALLFAIFLFFRGHVGPGGGFVAGLVTGVALILQYMASGISWSRKRLPADYRPLVGGGLLIGVGTGLAGWAFGRAFLASGSYHGEVPLLGQLEISSTLLFDAGIAATVIGVVMLILTSLGRLSRDVPDTGPG